MTDETEAGWEPIGRFVRIRHKPANDTYSIQFDLSLAEWAGAEDELDRDTERAFAVITERFAAKRCAKESNRPHG
jgi:hypothetical protein